MLMLTPPSDMIIFASIQPVVMIDQATAANLDLDLVINLAGITGPRRVT